MWWKHGTGFSSAAFVSAPNENLLCQKKKGKGRGETVWQRLAFCWFCMCGRSWTALIQDSKAAASNSPESILIPALLRARRWISGAVGPTSAAAGKGKRGKNKNSRNVRMSEWGKVQKKGNWSVLPDVRSAGWISGCRQVRGIEVSKTAFTAFNKGWLSCQTFSGCSHITH